MDEKEAEKIFQEEEIQEEESKDKESEEEESEDEESKVEESEAKQREDEEIKEEESEDEDEVKAAVTALQQSTKKKKVIGFDKDDILGTVRVVDFDRAKENRLEQAHKRQNCYGDQPGVKKRKVQREQIVMGINEQNCTSRDVLR
jgi:hypothetical protein